MNEDDLEELPPEEQLQWLIEEAESGDPEAKRELGRMYAHGFVHPVDSTIELKPDVEAAQKWLSEAIDEGDGEAASLLAQMFDGEATKGPFDNPEEAFRCYQQAVDLDYRPARLYLAAGYLIGRGVERNDRRAKELFIEAAYAGDTDAQTMMGEICRKNGDEVAASAWEVVASIFGSDRHDDIEGKSVPSEAPEQARQMIQKVNIYSVLVVCDAPVLVQAADLLRKSFLDEIDF